MSRNYKCLKHLPAFLLCSAGFVWGIQAPSPIAGILTSSASVVVFNEHRKREGFGIGQLLGESTRATVPLLETAADCLEQAKPDEEAHPIIRYGYQFLRFGLGGSTLDSDPDLYSWFTNARFGLGGGLLPYGNWLIGGMQREGKTVAAKHLFKQYVEQHPGAKLLVCDIDNQSHVLKDKEGWPLLDAEGLPQYDESYWFGMPVAQTKDEILGAFNEIDAYMNLAKGDGTDPGLCVIFDELPRTFNAMDNKERERVISILQNINFAGAKRKVLILSVTHTLMGSQLKWPGITDFIPDCNVLVFQRFSVNDKNFGNLQRSESLERARAQVAAYEIPDFELKAPRPCILYTVASMEWKVRIIPPLENPQVWIKEDEEIEEKKIDDRFELIAPFLEEVDLPEHQLGFRELLRICGCDKSIHRMKDRKYYPVWMEFLEHHNAQFPAIPEIATPQTTESDQPETHAEQPV